MRHFRPDPVSPEVLEALLTAADMAPSVGLSQPWRFVLVDDPARRAAVRANFLSCNAAAQRVQPDDRAAVYAQLKLEGLDQAPSQFALFVEPDPEQGHGLGRATMPETVAYSAVMAVHTLWLAARAVGLGLGWVSIVEPAEISRVLDVPAEWRFIGYFCLGTPVSEDCVPELERAGWEQRRPLATRLVQR